MVLDENEKLLQLGDFVSFFVNELSESFGKIIKIEKVYEERIGRIVDSLHIQYYFNSQPIKLKQIYYSNTNVFVGVSKRKFRRRKITAKIWKTEGF